MFVRLAAAPFVLGATLALAPPAIAAVTVYTNEATFDAAVPNAATYTPVQDASFASSYSFGPVTETAGDFLVTYTGDYGPGVRELGAFGSPVNYSSTQNALGLAVGYYVGPQKATYTIDGVTGTIEVPDNDGDPNTAFIGFIDTSDPISVSFQTDSAEFDTIRVLSGEVSATPEPSSWALLIAGVAMTGSVLRRRWISAVLTRA